MKQHTLIVQIGVADTLVVRERMPGRHGNHEFGCEDDLASVPLLKLLVCHNRQINGVSVERMTRRFDCGG